MKKFLRHTGIFAIIGILGFTLSACGHNHNPEEKAEWMVHKITRKLDLNEDQQTKLQAVADEFIQHHRAQRQNKQQHMESLLAEIRKPEIDKAVLTQMFEQHQADIAQLAPRIIDKLAIFHASLDSEQKEKLAKKLEYFQKKHSHYED